MDEKRQLAFRIGSIVILRNYAAGKKGRYDTYVPIGSGEKMKRIGCELTLAHSIRVAKMQQKESA